MESFQHSSGTRRLRLEMALLYLTVTSSVMPVSLSYIFGLEPRSGDDPLLDLNERALQAFVYAAVPETWLVVESSFVEYL
jgi:hypothetical protein